MITIPCPSCGKAFDTEDTLAGRSAVCPACAASARPPAPGLAADEERCPYCAEVIKKGARLCRFCKTDLERPPEPVRARPAPAAAPKKSSAVVWILLGAFLFIGVVCVGGSVFVVMSQKGVFGEVMVQGCRQQLSSLYSGVRAHEEEAGGLPQETGSRFWKKIAESRDLEEVLQCPAAALSDTSRGSWPYRGPAVPWSRVPEDGIVACDRIRSHPKGINVLFKNGRVEFAPKDGDLYRRALAETSE